MWDNWEISGEAIKLVAAALIGGLIGFERETHGQAAGLRTNVLICTGACLLMMISLHMEVMYRDLEVSLSVVRLDPARIASYAIASMGFLGAGAIITGKGTVKGLTTAASIWLTTAIGIAIGAAYYIPAVVSAIISLIVLYGFRQIKKYLPKDEHTLLTLTFASLENRLDQIRTILAYHEITINFVNYYLEEKKQHLTYQLRLQSRHDIPWTEVSQALRQLADLVSLSWTEAPVP